MSHCTSFKLVTTHALRPVNLYFCTKPAYGWAQGYAVKIEPEAWRIVDGKLYLNYDLDIQKKWNKNPQRWIELANKNWAAAQKKQ